MLLTLTATARPATDLGYLLHKNQARVQYGAEEAALERRLSLNEQRLDRVAEVLASTGPKRVVDLGCGEGRRGDRVTRHEGRPPRDHAREAEPRLGGQRAVRRPCYAATRTARPPVERADEASSGQPRGMSP